MLMKNAGGGKAVPKTVKSFDDCTLVITADDTHITGISFADDDLQPGGDENAVIAQCILELEEYFACSRTRFSVPVRAQGTPFQQRVWETMEKIPYGETRTYGDVARMMGKDKASRAVGAACGKNPVAILLPCHRVVGAKGDMGGYAYGPARKAYLLELEKKANIS